MINHTSHFDRLNLLNVSGNIYDPTKLYVCFLLSTFPYLFLFFFNFFKVLVMHICWIALKIDEIFMIQNAYSYPTANMHPDPAKHTANSQKLLPAIMCI